MSMIVKHITYLLRNHDCVVAPGLGAFIAQRVSAHIDKERNLMCPPTRMLGFNAEIGHDDGLLASSVARQMNVSYQQAQKIVATEMDALRCQLINTGEISLPRIGTLHYESDGRITFEPFGNNVVSASYLGLRPVNMVPLHRESTDSPIGETTTEVRPMAYRRWIKVAASIAVLFCMGALLSTPIDLSDTQLASLGITVTEPQEVIAEPEIVNFELKQPSPSARLNIAIPDEASTAIVPRIIAPKLTIADEEAPNYYLIVASLPSERLAKKFIADDGNPNLGIIKGETRYRVYVATGSTQEETMAQLYTDDLSSRYPDAWVFSK